MISVDVAQRRITLDVDDATLARRAAERKVPAPRFERGYGWMFARHISQADQGCDFDFLRSDFGISPGEPAIY
jgi:dihydroxy-acid dehydratase